MLYTPETLVHNRTLIFIRPCPLRNSTFVKADKILERAVAHFEDCLFYSTPSYVSQARAVGRHQVAVASAAGSMC